MTITLELPDHVESTLQAEARQRGVGIEEHALNVLRASLVPEARRVAAIALIDSWRTAKGTSAQEQQETGKHLVQNLDTNRPQGDKLFPSELKGRTW